VINKMDEWEKQVLGYALVSILGFTLPVIVYGVELLNANPIVIAWLVSLVGVIGTVLVAFIRHRFKLPEGDEDPEEVIPIDAAASYTTTNYTDVIPDTLVPEEPKE
jgi:hypothetical protein